jgi:hypothetical protein
MSAFLEHVDAMAHGRWLVGVGAAVVLIQIAALGMAKQRAGRAGNPGGSLWLIAVSGVAILALLAVAGISVSAARTTMSKVFELTSPSEKSAALSEGISGQLNAIPAATGFTALAVLLWWLGLHVTVQARNASGRDESVFPVAIITLGLTSAAFGALMWAAELMRAFVASKQVPPDEKVTLLLQSFDLARSHFQLFARISSWTILGLAALAFVWTLIARRSAEIAAPRTSKRSGRITWMFSAGAVVATVALSVAVRPLRAENALPWPPPALGDRLLVVDPATPQVRGPDAVERAPIVQVFRDKIALDGFVRPIESLGEHLGRLRATFSLLQPDASFNGATVIVADAKIPTARLVSVLGVVHHAGFSRPLFAFTKREVLVRPVFGRLERVTATGVEVVLVDALDAEVTGDEKGGQDGVPVRAGDFKHYDDLARRLVAARERGRPVVLDLGI